MKQAKFAYSLLGNAFEKQTKAIEDQGEKQIDTITNRKDNYKEIFEKLAKERFDEIKELTNEISHDDLMYYFKGNTATKRFNDFTNGIELSKRIESGEMKLEEAKILQNVFKSNLNKMSREIYKSEDQESGKYYIALQITRSCY